jgi:ABC-type polar amino acid transport system ATPase subunit
MAPGVTVLDVRALGVRRGGRGIVEDVTFAAERGDIVAIMGPSGAGKTTVVRAIAGLEPLSGGTIGIDGFRLSAGGVPRGRALRALHERVGMVFQFHHLFAHLTALQNVWLAPVHVRGEDRGDAERRARALLDALGVGDRAEALPRDLSGGEAQRVAIARALAVNPPLLLMDEPTASLDAVRRSELADTVRRLSGEGRTVVVATHDADFARACARQVVVMETGRIARQGEAARLLT